MKLIIAGSRNITEYTTLREYVISEGIWKKYRKELEIVSGCARGVDSLAITFAQKNGLVLHKFPADWDSFGKRAGILRNEQMGNFADGLLALWDGSSRGTKHMIDYMTKLNKPVWVVVCKEVQ